ncbi:hypothetical protein D3C77_371440 [compost metagenome]
MDTKIVYQTDHLGIYTGPTVADRSPLEPDVWLIPAGCVDVAPPAVPEFKAAHWDGKRWQLIDSYHGLTAYNVETLEPMVIDRLGALPPGYTLEVPGPGQIWDGQHWVDDVPAVVALRYREKLEAINSGCLQQITGGIWSLALGDRHYYGTELEDQLNLIGLILRGSGGAYACRNAKGVTSYLEHTQVQLLQVSDEFTTFKLALLQRANELKQALLVARDAEDLDALNAIVWEVVTP